MSDFVSILPNTLMGWITTVLATIATVVVIFNKIRQSDMQILRQSNEDLRAAHDDNTKKIEELQIEVHKLSDKIRLLENTNKTLEDLVKTALEQFFKENPKMAFKIAKDIDK
jgi:flagellar biosynthesis/type III secretory pathway M-ring protein FliF/YscJ